LLYTDPRKFWLLTTLSAVMVTLAAVIYTATTTSDSFAIIDCSPEYKKLREAVVRDNRVISQYYKLGKKLGVGSYATVFEAVSIVNPLLKVAVKVITKQSIKLREGDEATVLSEIATMKTINHPNIVKYYDHFEDDTHFYLVLEKLDGGELFDRIGKKVKYNENEARELFVIMLRAVKYLHDRNLVHRDIKPENLLMVNDSDDAQVKLADFGFAKYAAGLSLTTRIGSPFYMAPEIISCRSYGTSVKMEQPSFMFRTYICRRTC
jgi:calcium/calmodulin-dependent protein kinase I